MAKETKKEPTAVAQYDYSQAGVTGFENVTQQDLGIPFLQILQKGNPQVDEAHPDYTTKKIEGAKVGDIINTVKNTVVWSRASAAALQFIPCAYERVYVEWKARESGGGLVKMHNNANILMECKRNERGQDQLKNGNIVVTTGYFYGLAMVDGEYIPCLIGLSSSQIKKAKMWLNMASALKLDGPQGKFTPPLFSHAYALSSVPESNEKGNWYGWQIRMHGIVNDPSVAQLAAETAKEKAAGRAALPAPASEQF